MSLFKDAAELEVAKAEAVQKAIDTCISVGVYPSQTDIEAIRCGVAAGFLVIANRLKELHPDISELGEDVTTHCMGNWFSHEDGRGCAYHHRLDAWITMDSDKRWTKKCLRDHPAP